MNTWEETNCSQFVFDEAYKILTSGVGILDWNIDEIGNIKPCSFFPIVLFNIGDISNLGKSLQKRV